jgi:hypothetical protein
MPTPLPELLTRVDELNDPQSPFRFSADGDRIVGTWDIAHVQYVALLGAGQIDEHYRIDAEFEPDSGTYWLDELSQSSDVGAGVGPGGFRIGGTRSWVKGKQWRLGQGAVGGLFVRTPEGDGNTATWAWDTARVKKHLVDFLEANGWRRRKGFFARVFG